MVETHARHTRSNYFCGKNVGICPWLLSLTSRHLSTWPTRALGKYELPGEYQIHRTGSSGHTHLAIFTSLAHRKWQNEMFIASILKVEILSLRK